MYKQLPVINSRTLPTPALAGEGKATDKANFSALYDRFAPILLGVITNIIPDKAASVVVLEDAFLAIHAQLDQFQPGKQPLFTWLLHITRNTAIDALRKRRQILPGNLKLSETGEVIRVADPGAPADAQQTALLDAVLFKNCTPQEAALSLNIPVEQAQQQLRLAVQNLRQRSDV
ncbi:RNA polymerase sigma factor [Spirosoma luteum]|uniref:RNA polymerase sigma factor n=1 Tax=Spirosoma luteum TaxID=431553 RepID=UPI000378F6D4|nr:sigma factor [Spirosoma luteum]